MIPRIRGRVGTGDDGKFYFEMSLWDLHGENCAGKWDFGPWNTEAIAHDEMKKCARFMTETLEKEKGGEPSGKFLDMKNGGILRPWDQH